MGFLFLGVYCSSMYLLLFASGTLSGLCKIIRDFNEDDYYDTMN